MLNYITPNSASWTMMILCATLAGHNFANGNWVWAVVNTLCSIFWFVIRNRKENENA